MVGAGFDAGVDDFAQFAQMIRAGVDLDDSAAGLQYTGEFWIDREAEQAEHAVTTAEERPSALGHLEAVKADVKKIAPPTPAVGKLKTKDPEL